MNRTAALSRLGLIAVLFTAVFRSYAAEHNFAAWEKEVAAFERMDRTNPPPKGALLFIGSSTIRLWKTLATDFPEQRVINRGVGGCQIVDCTYYADRIAFPYEPRMIFFRCGGNDLWSGKSAAQVFADFKEFVAKVHAKLPETEVAFIALNPSIARWKQADKDKEVNALVQAWAKEVSHVKYIEIYDMVLGADGRPRPDLFVADKLHFNQAGYKLLVERVRPFLPKK